jgi:Poly-gamma-glutamate hydrolase
MSDDQGSYVARFKLDTRPPPGRLAKEHCMANRVQVEKIGRHRDEQVRIEFPTAKGTISAIFTVSVFHNDDADLVLLGRKIKTQLQNCQLSNKACRGEVISQIMIEDLDDDEEAEKRGELIEHLNHDGQNHKLVVIAPHGGEIEKWTDNEVEYVGNHFSSERVSLWVCKGFSSKDDDDAFERWHITATDISEKSFPGLHHFWPKV